MKEEARRLGGRFQAKPPEEFTNIINSLLEGDLSMKDKVVPSFCAAIRDLCTVYVLVPLNRVRELCDGGRIPTILTRQNESTSILVGTTETMAQRLMCVGLLMRLQRVVELALENKAVTDLCIFGDTTTPIHISRPTLQRCLDATNAENAQ
jgi:hypothetical protein